MNRKMLDNAYGLMSAAETRAFYDAWAESYDAEIAENGYATPDRCAAALAQFATARDIAVLDIGCGTGMSGSALTEAGFTVIDGCDFSAEMLARAQAKGIYRTLVNTDLENPFPFEPGAYGAITAMGVLNPGHAPATTLDEVLALLPPGGLFAFSLNDHALADGSYEGRINENVDTGAARLLFREEGQHLPGIGLNSTVYVLEKT